MVVNAKVQRATETSAISVWPFELRDLAVLLQVARTGSFRGAAQILGVEPSAVSRRIRALEDCLGASLFERRRSGVSATNAGRRFQAEVRLVLEGLDSATRNMRQAGEARLGQLDIGVISSLPSRFLGRLLTSFRDDHRDVCFNFVEGGQQEHITGIADRSIDLALVLEASSQGSLDWVKLWTEPVFAALPSDDARSRMSVIRFEALAKDQFIVSHDPPGPEVHDLIIRRLSGINFHPRVQRQKVGREGLLSLVGLGFGISLVCGAEKRIAYPNVTFVPLLEEHISICAIWSPNNDNPALRRFLSLARQLSREEQQASAFAQTRDPSP